MVRSRWLVTGAASLALGQGSRRSPDTASRLWTPSEEQAKAVIEDLRIYFSEISEARKLAFSSYRFQIVGFYRNGKKMIYINAFRQLPSMSWRDEPVVIFDGGTGFFGVEYDLALKSFSEFQFNGYA